MTYSKNSDGGLDIKMDTNKYIRWPSDVVGYITKEKLETAGFIDESEGGGFSLDNVLFKRTSSSDGNKWTTDKAYSSLFVITFSGSGGNNAQSAANYGLLVNRNQLTHSELCSHGWGGGGWACTSRVYILTNVPSGFELKPVYLVLNLS